MESKVLIKEGEVLFNEGSFSDSAFIIVTGKLEVSKMDKEGRKTVIGTLKKNDIVGEMGLIDGCPRSATVTALRDTYVTIITREQFEVLSKKNPDALMPILKVLSQRLRDTLGLIINPPEHQYMERTKKITPNASWAV